ncbi:Uu.00g043770.m01.CDS01 [Anthostomella pinea]|uniref:Putative gamma-glutamylcyclotransferase n=1 Tax=Anthostomella pinea TaxID=933095 RepID=A0AAI8YBV0_9PEZI|nr:Uu.00g043770.m01.CDS01 [Anthostomella pinea]
MDPDTSSSAPPPPPPPAPPPLPRQCDAKPSSIAYKVRSAPPGWAYDSKVNTPGRDELAPPVGTYFFYGTLQDPSLLADILDLPVAPVLRPARVIGYHLELWGQYPALVCGPTDAVVRGSAWEVPDEEAAGKLAAYETNNYDAVPCNVYESSDSDDGEQRVPGFTFVFCGDRADLTEGSFDLDVWLRRMDVNKPLGGG